MPASGEPTPDGKRLLAGTIAAASPAVLVAHWRAFLATAAQGGYIARYRGETLSLETAADASALALDLHARVVSHETLAEPYPTLTSGRTLQSCSWRIKCAHRNGAQRQKPCPNLACEISLKLSDS